MNIGDKVRSLHGHEEGIVTRMLKYDQVEVEIEDGFSIPFLKKDLVVVTTEESKHFQKPNKADVSQVASTQAKKSLHQEGLYLAFVPVNDRVISMHFVNNSGYEILVSCSELANQNCKGLLSAKVMALQSINMGNRELTHLDQWPELSLQIIYHKSGLFSLKAPLIKKVSFKAKTFFKKKTLIPVLGKDGYLLKIDEDATKIDIHKIKERMMDPVQEVKPSVAVRPENKVDLHIEKLTNDYQKLTTEEMLDLQMKIFREKLDQAIMAGLDSIIFIHGVGNGTLRNKIHRYCSQMPNIRFFKDTGKEKFGYGATEVRIN